MDNERSKEQDIVKEKLLNRWSTCRLGAETRLGSNYSAMAVLEAPLTLPYSTPLPSLPFL
jgi:hypothetical protein